jgi:hypothetical protein
MKCPRCGSTDVNIQIVSETEIRTKKKKERLVLGFLLGGILEPILWISSRCQADLGG